MDEKDKNELNPNDKSEFETDNKEVFVNPHDDEEEIEVIEEKTDEEKLAELKDLAEVEDEIQQMIREMEMYLDDNTQKVKIVKITEEQRKAMRIYTLIEIILSIVLLFSSTGYIGWIECDKLYQYFILIGGIVLIEYLIKYILKKYFFRFLFITFGGILLIAPLVGFIVSIVFTPGANVVNYGLLILTFILYLVIKKIFMTIVKGDFRKALENLKP